MTVADARPNFSGVWKLNLEKSVMRGAMPKQMLVNIEHRDPTVIQQILSTDTNGAEQRQIFTFRIGVDTKNVISGIELQSSTQWIGNELAIKSDFVARGREFHFKDHWSLSDDGRTLTMAHRDDDLAGQIAVLEKMPDAESARFDDF